MQNKNLERLLTKIHEHGGSKIFSAGSYSYVITTNFHSTRDFLLETIHDAGYQVGAVSKDGVHTIHFSAEN